MVIYVKRKSLSFFLPLGLLIKFASTTAMNKNILNDLFRGFFDGISLVFIIAGTIFLLLSQETKKK